MKRLRSLVAGVLLASASVLFAPVAAQVSVVPAAVEASVPSGQQAMATLTVGNASTDLLSFALSLAPAPSADNPPSEPGEVLFTSEETASLPSGITMTPEGRLFVERGGGGARETLEFSAELDFVREFEHPFFPVPGSATGGITYRPDAGTLWWLDIIRDCMGSTCTVEQVLLLEGDFDGEATGRELAVPWADGIGECGSRSAIPTRPAYAADTGRFFWLDNGNDTIWAMDTTGVVIDGYPVSQTDYAGVPQPDNPGGCLVNSGLDAHALGGEPILETVTGYPLVHPRNRQYTVVVLDRWGRNRGAETPLFDLPTPDGFGVVRWIADVVRSQLDPSVLYLTVTTGKGGASNRYWVYAVRAAPLPPVWLHASPILFSVEGESEREVTLVLDATGLEPGVYEGVAEVRLGDGIGPVLVEVPVMLTVTEGTASEEGPASEASRLGAPYPNPAQGMATVPLNLAEAAEVRVAVYDVLGREVVVLREGRLAVGSHRLSFDTAALPAGVYLVRAVSGSRILTQRLTVLR
jgi:hypothetical protein